MTDVFKVKNVMIMHYDNNETCFVIAEDCLPKGWHNTFLEYMTKVVELFEKHNTPLSELRLVQVKEKFGAARVYFEAPTDLYEMMTMLTDALETDTERQCCECGAPATHRPIGGWILPYCLKCAEERTRFDNERHKKNWALGDIFRTL